MIRAPIIDRPNQRSSHLQPVPRSGGVAIVVTTYVGLITVFVLGDQFTEIETQLFGLSVGALVIAVAGFLDDLDLLQSFKPKLLLQVLACTAVLSSGVIIDRVPLPFIGYAHLDWWGYPITLIWILALTNIVNFMDGLDGLAAGTAAIVAAFFGLIAISQGSTFAHIMGFILCAACTGFFLFNFPRATIFMGDVGSQFLGFFLAALTILAAGQDTAPLSILAIPLLFFHFIFDTVFTFLRRLIARENVTEAHKSHLYQLLNQIGYSHAQVSILHFLITITQGIGAIFLVKVSAANEAMVFLPFLAFQSAYAVVVLRLAKSRGVI